ncbi:MAG: hypothetical protein HY720_31615 [Planctomycetes bacterium]|nr:hypothetical protein [Planctomycetota bacterium]
MRDLGSRNGTAVNGRRVDEAPLKVDKPSPARCPSNSHAHSYSFSGSFSFSGSYSECCALRERRALRRAKQAGDTRLGHRRELRIRVRQRVRVRVRRRVRERVRVRVRGGRPTPNRGFSFGRPVRGARPRRCLPPREVGTPR